MTNFIFQLILIIWCNIVSNKTKNIYSVKHLIKTCLFFPVSLFPHEKKFNSYHLLVQTAIILLYNATIFYVCLITISDVLDSCWENQLVIRRLRYMAIIKIQIAVTDIPLWLRKYSFINRALIHFVSCDLSGKFAQPGFLFSEAAKVGVASVIRNLIFSRLQLSSNTFLQQSGLKPKTVLQKCRHYNLLSLI